MTSSANFLSTGNAYDAQTWQQTDSRARANTRALGLALYTRGFMRDAVDQFGHPVTEYIGETAARQLDLDKEDLAALDDATIADLVHRHQQTHFEINLRLYLADRAA